MHGACLPLPVTQPYSTSNVDEAAPFGLHKSELDLEVTASLMLQIREGVTTNQTILVSTRNARVMEAVMAGLQDSFQSFILTLLRQRDPYWRKVMEEQNKVVEARASSWHWQTQQENMDSQFQRMTQERDRRVMELEA